MGEMNMNQTTQPEVSKKLTKKRYYEVHVDLLCGGRTFKLL